MLILVACRVGTVFMIRGFMEHIAGALGTAHGMTLGIMAMVAGMVVMTLGTMVIIAGIILGIMAIAAGMVGDTHIMDMVGVIPIIIVTDIMLVARGAQQVGVVGEVQVQTENIQQEAL